MGLNSVHIVWFKRDLRVSDHRPLAAAARRGTVLPLYIVEPALWMEPDMAGRHWAFIAESLEELRADLATLGQPLVVRTGSVTGVLAALERTYRIESLSSHEETGNAWTYARDRDVGGWCRERGIAWEEWRQNGVIRRLKSRNGWAKVWDQFMAMPMTDPPKLRPIDGLAPGIIPAAKDLGLADDPCPLRQRGGRRAAQETLYSFLHQRAQTYRRAMSSPVTGEYACSRLSAHLAWGTMSMREAAQATWARQREVKLDGLRDGWRGSLSSFSGRLHWHCHFMQKLEDAPSIETEALHPATKGLRPAEPDAARLEAWCKGETGLPFVDACMRYLRAGGWLNFRMRAMVMAVSSYHLWLDWRQPGLHLARQFTDYEPGIHWPQTQMQSGTTGINTVRIYNPVKQGGDQDPTGTFTRRWVPELAEVPDKFLQDPWKWDGARAILGKSYPAPIVDPVIAAREAKEKVYGARKGKAFREEANRIQEKHGSRKSGMPSSSRRSKKAKSAAEAGQMTLDI